MVWPMNAADLFNSDTNVDSGSRRVLHLRSCATCSQSWRRLCARDHPRPSQAFESCAGMVVVNANSRSSMCSSLVAITKHQFHGKIPPKKKLYMVDWRALTPAGKSTRSKMFFCDFEMEKLEYLLSCRGRFIPALLVVSGSWSVARKYAVFVVMNARMRTRSRRMAKLTSSLRKASTL